MKPSRQDVNDFLQGKNIAVVGASRSRWKFGAIAYEALKKKGFRVFAVNPNAEKIGEDACFATIQAIPEAIDSVLIVTKPNQTEAAVRDAAHAGVKRVWMQQGAASDEAIRFCQEHGIQVIAGECILMFAEPVKWLHRAHRWLWGALGKLPE